jgi:Putative threonine efflux protein
MLEFFIAALVIGIAPGPDNLFVLAQSATYGARLGFCIILGLCTGIAIHTCLLVAGVSALIAASPTAFFAIQCLGAAYLLYLAYKSFGVRAGVVVSSEFGIRNSESCHPERNAVESKDPDPNVIPAPILVIPAQAGIFSSRSRPAFR